MVKKKNVFGILSTGLGKSLIFQMLPRVLKETWKIERSTVLVVSPLVSIMKDQLKAFVLGLSGDGGRKELLLNHLYSALLRFAESVTTFGDSERRRSLCV